jgi:aminoglycoside 2'-N-acetyltransferase I
LVGHAAVVERILQAGQRQLRTGYVEAVATVPARQGQGIGRLVMTRVGRILTEGYEMGALATGVNPFYRGLGWEDWLGPTAVRDGSALRYTPGEDGHVMVMRFGRSAGLALDMILSVTPRSGDDW